MSRNAIIFLPTHFSVYVYSPPLVEKILNTALSTGLPTKPLVGGSQIKVNKNF